MLVFGSFCVVCYMHSFNLSKLLLCVQLQYRSKIRMTLLYVLILTAIMSGDLMSKAVQVSVDILLLIRIMEHVVFSLLM